MIREIVNVKDPVLRKKAKPVRKIDKHIKGLFQDLKDTLSVQDDPEGVGLAAPQIGKSLQIFAMKPNKRVRIIINPKIIWIKDVQEKNNKSKNSKSSKKKSSKKATNSEKATGPEGNTEPEVLEGCLSLPYYYGPIKKPNRIKISYLNEKGEKVEKIFKDFEAQIIQHEIDHLKGILFVDRLLEQKKPLYKVTGDEWEKVDLF